MLKNKQKAMHAMLDGLERGDPKRITGEKAAPTATAWSCC
jgi:hypothetical protein